MKLSPVLAVSVLAMVMASCGGVRQQSIRTSSRVFPPRPVDSQIDIYRFGQTPDFVFEEVGVVSATKQASSAFGSASITDLLPVIQRQARELGADAIIIQDADEFMSASLNGSLTIPVASVSGIAIHYVKTAVAEVLILPPDTRPSVTTAITTEELVASAASSVVQIETDQAQGSGVIISADGLILTNDHVIAEATVILVKLLDGRRSTAVVQSTDSLADIALLKVSLTDLAPIRLGSIEGVTVGSDVVVIGSPLGLAQTVSKGIVSSVRRLDGRRVIQTDAAVSPGNSGGPMLNDRGEVIGIVSFKLSRPLSEGLNFAMSIDDALEAVGVTPTRRLP